jgi:hypothetical protein
MTLSSVDTTASEACKAGLKTAGTRYVVLSNRLLETSVRSVRCDPVHQSHGVGVHNSQRGRDLSNEGSRLLTVAA